MCLAQRFRISTHMYTESCQMSKMQHLAKIVNGFHRKTLYLQCLTMVCIRLNTVMHTVNNSKRKPRHKNKLLIDFTRNIFQKTS